MEGCEPTYRNVPRVHLLYASAGNYSAIFSQVHVGQKDVLFQGDFGGKPLYF